MENLDYMRTPPQEVDSMLDADFSINSEIALTPQEKDAVLDEFWKYVDEQRKNFLGYQVNLNMDYSTDLSRFLDVHINNVGDPFTQGNLTLNSKKIERAVLEYFAKLWKAKTPYDAQDGESYWGYVTSMGSSEGNMFGLWSARDYLSGLSLNIDPKAVEKAKQASHNGFLVRATPKHVYTKPVTVDDKPAAFQPIAFFSQDTHYSVVKAMNVLSIETFYVAGSGKYECPLRFPDDYPRNYSKGYLDENNWPLEVPSDENGSIHIPALVLLVKFFAEKGHPILVNFNYGTTFKGAYDNVQKAVDALVPVLKENKLYERDVYYDKNDPSKFDTRSGYWFHVDGALGASYMPFLGSSYTKPVFDFRIPEIHSISTSGHKWIGAPWPCCVYISKVKYQLTPPDDPMYIGSADTTFAGSRNGFSALVLWNYLTKNTPVDIAKKISDAQSLASYAYDKIKNVSDTIGIDLWVERSDLSLAIRMKKPNNALVFKYSLSCESMYVDEVQRNYCHIYIMDSVKKELIDAFATDLLKVGAFEN